jgi:hypothetical protein
MTEEERVQFATALVWTNTPWGEVMHLKVWRSDGSDGITWDQLQELKNETMGPEVCAIEFYPAESDLVNEVKMRHLWEVPPWTMTVPMRPSDPLLRNR